MIYNKRGEMRIGSKGIPYKNRCIHVEIMAGLALVSMVSLFSVHTLPRWFMQIPYMTCYCCKYLGYLKVAGFDEKG
jgi:hypothetical protein